MLAPDPSSIMPPHYFHGIAYARYEFYAAQYNYARELSRRVDELAAELAQLKKEPAK
jgi:hypothetical protein